MRDDRSEIWQNVLFFITFILGCIISWTILFAPIHEAGHVNAFRIDGIIASILDWNHTATEKLTPHGMIAGFMSEFFFFISIFIFCFIVSNPYKGGIRRFYFHLGFPFGYCNGIFFYALFSTDFMKMAGSGIVGAWCLFTLPFLIIGWIVLIITRLTTIK